MKDDRKAEIRRHYGELLDVQEKLRILVRDTGLDVELESSPGEPSNVDQLAEAMNVVRGNMTRMATALNLWDRELNGCETRTRETIQEDIEQDRALLDDPSSDTGGRSRDEIELNVAYDQMQLGRI